MDDVLKSEADFIQYVMSIPSIKEPSEPVAIQPKNPQSSISKVGLDHLDNLCKLMEQLGELKDNNSKLQKRVQYLEDLKTLHDMHKEICDGSDYNPEDNTQSKSQPFFPLQKSATVSHCPKKMEEEADIVTSRSPSRYLSRRSRSHHSTGQRRGRSKSVGHEDLSEDPKSRRIFPKWSRVKEAFGWESERKASIKDKSVTSRRRSDESRTTLNPHYIHPSGSKWYTECPSIHSSAENINTDIEVQWTKKKTSLQIENDTDQMRVMEAEDGNLNREDMKTKPSEDSDLLKDDMKRGKSPWGRVKTILERHRDSLKRRSVRRDHSVPELESLSKIQSNDFDPSYYLDSMDSNSFCEPKGSRIGSNSSDPSETNVHRSSISSPNSPRKSKWNRMNRARKGKDERNHLSLSSPTSPMNDQEGNFTFDLVEEPSSQDTFDEKKDPSSHGSETQVHQLPITLPSSELVQHLQRNLSQDFHRKIQEWERIRGSGTHSRSQKPDDKTLKAKLKDLSWLEKELQKIEKEKQRLSKERQKYEERAIRLEKLKETALNSSNKREVLIRTSAGEFRFEGISDAFTKKLYEWETKRGLGPELSTIALLDSSRSITQPTPILKMAHLQRVLSRSESSVADIGQPSHTSSNSLPSVKLPDSLDLDRPNHPSRANSEPDLSTLNVFSNGTNLSVSTLTRHTTDTSDGEMATPDINKEDPVDGEPYYDLLKENVILLEQLKEKEEICGRLEKDLEILDDKMADMNSCHVKETQRYREKLWELHQQGATPRDVQCCRHTMMQLRNRIEALERWTEKLRNDRETIEVNIRHHSKEQESMTLDLLEKMRELKAVGSPTEGTELRKSSLLDPNTMERLQELSALLTKQTQDLERTLTDQTRQICQLKWELLHRDLSNVKKETEMHSHGAFRKRSKYAHWRSRSSEEASTGNQMLNPMIQEALASDMYSSTLPIEEFKATHLAKTVEQLNKEVLKLTSATSISSLQRYFQDDECSSKLAAIKTSDNSKIIQKKAPSTSKRITVRRTSADNLSAVSTSDNRLNEDSSSEDSSEDYYSRICYNTNVPLETERLLLPYGEQPPRQKRKKLSKYQPCLGRRRSNTFHTQRDLQKPNIVENVPHKCQSFRIHREKVHFEQDKFFNQNRNLNDIVKDDEIQSASKALILQRLQMKKSNLEKLDMLKTSNNLSKEVSSDSKIPHLMQTQYQNEEKNIEKHAIKSTRSLSEKTRKESTTERRELLQKKKFRKRLKSPEASCNTTVEPKSNFVVACGNNNEQDNLQSRNGTLNNLGRDTEIKKNNSKPDIPTITLQLPKRKQRKYACIKLPNLKNDDQNVTIVIPKKRSFSSESSGCSDLTNTHSESASPNKPNAYQAFDSNNCSNIHLMKLVSLDNFETPFSEKEKSVRLKTDEPYLNSQTEEMMDMLAARGSDTQHILSRSSTSNTTDTNSENTVTHYVKSPSAPQLDWRRTCAKKVSKGGAPNVRTLIEKYNQKLIETYQSPLSSNVNSPIVPRKTSNPVQTCTSLDFVPRFQSTPNTPTVSPTQSPLILNVINRNIAVSPSLSPLTLARSEALRRAKENFISSEAFPIVSPIKLNAEHQPDLPTSKMEGSKRPDFLHKDVERSISAEDSMSSSDSMNVLMLRAGENCRELRMPKRTSDKPEASCSESTKFKPSKSLSSSSLFKAVLSPDFKMPSSLLRLKRSKRKKDMSTVTELCRQSLMLTTDDVNMLPSPASHKSCPSSPELKSKNIVKPSWFQKNIFRHK